MDVDGAGEPHLIVEAVQIVPQWSCEYKRMVILQNVANALLLFEQTSELLSVPFKIRRNSIFSTVTNFDAFTIWCCENRTQKKHLTICGCRQFQKNILRILLPFRR